MNFIERHWFVIVAIVALWWLANYGSSTTTIGGVPLNNSDAAPGDSWFGGNSSDTGPLNMDDNFWTVLGGAAILAILL